MARRLLGALVEGLLELLEGPGQDLMAKKEF